VSFRIICIRKDNGDHENPYVAITNLRWQDENNGSTGDSSREQMYDWVHGGGVAVVIDGAGNRAQLEALLTARGTKYVRTRPAHSKTDNLLELPEC